MLKRTIIVASVIAAFAATPAFANDTTPKTTAAAAAYMPDKAEAGKLIGHRVENAQGQKVGEIEAIHIGKNGKVADVILGVGGFLEIGERNVSIPWSDLHMLGNGDKIMIAATKEQLKAMPEYKFAKAEQRKTVFETPF